MWCRSGDDLNKIVPKCFWEVYEKVWQCWAVLDALRYVICDANLLRTHRDYTFKVFWYPYALNFRFQITRPLFFHIFPGIFHLWRTKLSSKQFLWFALTVLQPICPGSLKSGSLGFNGYMSRDSSLHSNWFVLWQIGPIRGKEIPHLENLLLQLGQTCRSFFLKFRCGSLF